MNTIPLEFYDEVINRLSKSDIKKLKLSSGYWSSIAETHFNMRRELTVRLTSNKEGSKVGVKLYSWPIEVPFDIDFKYDRIKCIYFSELSDSETAEETQEHFRTKILPTIRSVASHCTLYATRKTPHPYKAYDALFDGLKECRGLSSIEVDNYGEKCHEFIRRQVEFGNLKALHLMRSTEWPADFQDLIKVFVKSPNSMSLYTAYSNVFLDFDTVSCVFDRFFRGELTAFGLEGSPTFPVDELRYDYEEFAVNPWDWNSGWSSAIWELPETDRKLKVTVRGRQITLYCY